MTKLIKRLAHKLYDWLELPCVLADWQIAKYAIEQGMIYPYEPNLVRVIEELKILSFGQSSFGYDIRLSPNAFKVFRRVPGQIMDPKDFKEENLTVVEYEEDEHGKYFILPGNSYGLGFSVEHFDIPKNVIGVCVGKSTNARIALLPGLTPLENGWRGYLTIEVQNGGAADARVYCNEGIAQIIFHRGLPSLTSYVGRKYQNQEAKIVMATV